MAPSANDEVNYLKCEAQIDEIILQVYDCMLMFEGYCIQEQSYLQNYNDVSFCLCISAM